MLHVRRAEQPAAEPGLLACPHRSGRALLHAAYKVYGTNRRCPAASSSASLVFDLFVSSAGTVGWWFSKLAKKETQGKMKWQVLTAAEKLQGSVLGDCVHQVCVLST